MKQITAGNPMFNEDEIKRQLQGKSREHCVALAVRSAMRVLPLLAVWSKADVGSFRFWPKGDRAKYMLAVYWAYSCSMHYVFVKGSRFNARTAAALAYAAYDAAYADAARAARAARAAAYAADVAAYGDADYAARAAAYAARAAAFAARAAIIQEIQTDLAVLNDVPAATFLTNPLWSQTMPDDWRQRLANFEMDALSLNAGFDVWLKWYQDRLDGKPLDIEMLNNWNNLPDELRSQGPAKVNAYLKCLQSNASVSPLNKVRAIFIGYGEAGKTSLIRALHNEPVVEGKEAMTPGIDIRAWPVPDTEIQAHFWDFGGQVVAHATHQFFLRSSCLYVLVLNARSEIDSTVQAEYWLEHVQSFGKDAPVLIVGNKADQTGINLDMGYLKGKYANIVGFYPLSCTQAQTGYKAEFDRFRRDFCDKLQQVGTHQMLFTPQQFAVLKDLRRRSPQAAFLKHSEFNDICSEHGIGTEGELNRDWLLDILDKLGVVVHFPQLTFLDEYVLNPRWLTYGVYTLMYAKQPKLTEREIVGLLSREKVIDETGNALDYPKHKCRFIMDAMQQFKLCYPLPGDVKTLIIPELLPTDQPELIPFEKQGALHFEFVFRGFLPRHVLPELIVNRHEEIDRQIVWQRGVLLQHKINHAQALVQVDYHERVLSIWVQGRNAKDYLGLLNDEVLKILGRLELDYKEWIALPVSACLSGRVLIREEEKAPYRQVLACAGKGDLTYTSESGLEYDLKRVLGIILSDAERTKEGGFYHFHAGSEVRFIQLGEGAMNETRNIKTQTYVEGDVNGGTIAGRDVVSFNFGDKDAENLLVQLLAEIKALNDKVPPVQARQLAEMEADATTLAAEVEREAPRKNQCELSLAGIKEAAVTLGDIAKPVFAIAEKLAPLLGMF